MSQHLSLLEVGTKQEKPIKVGTKLSLSVGWSQNQSTIFCFYIEKLDPSALRSKKTLITLLQNKVIFKY